MNATGIQAVAPGLPRRALLFDLAELEVLELALTDWAIDTWGGATRNPGYATAQAKIQAAIRCIAIERTQARLHA